MKIEFNLGKNHHGQEIALIARKDKPDRVLYDLVKYPADQRDDKVTLFNLTPDVMDALCAAVQKVKAITA